MKCILLAVALGALLAAPVFGQTGSQVISTTEGTSPTADQPPHHHPGRLTMEDMQELRSAHDAAMKANPGLDAEGKALMAKMDAYNKKVDAAMIQADPKVAPLLAKMGKERWHHHGGPGAPPPPPADGD